MARLFNKEKVNTKRQIEWDFAKDLAILIMITVHYMAFCSFGILDYGIFTEYIFIIFQVSAPIFMFAMGIGMVYTRHDSAREFIIRGIKLLGLGLIVNTMYFLSNYGAGVPLEYSLLSFLANDILQFAGLAFIIIGIFKKMGLPTLKMFVISILLSLISTLVGDLTLSNMYLNQLVGNIIGTVGQSIVSCFPLMSWLVVLVCGMMFGENLIKCNDKDELYTRLHRPACITSLILLIIGYITREGMFSTVGGTVPEKIEYLHASNSDIIILIFSVIFIVSILYFLTKRLSPKQEEFIVKTSKNVTIIYLIQWAIILLLGYINNQYLHIETNLIIAIVVWVFIILATLGLADLYVKIRSGLSHS